MKHYFSLCCIIKDENTYIHDWIRYHQIVGAEHFYIYDNESSIPVAETMKDEIAAGLVTVEKIQGKGAQFPAYNHCLKTYGHDNKWIGFIDMDEFLVPKSTDTVSEFLKPFEVMGAVGVNWLMFGSNGHVTRPADQLKAFTQRSEESVEVNNHIKSIVQPAKTRCVATPHDFRYHPGFFCVNENFVPIHGPFSPHSSNKIQLNHYYVRSAEEFKKKKERGRGDGVGARNDQDFIETNSYANKVQDLNILKHWK